MTTDDRKDFDFDLLDKDYHALLDLLMKMDSRHVWMVLSTALIEVTRSRDVPIESMLEALCRLWNMNSDKEQVVITRIADHAAIADPDGSVH